MIPKISGVVLALLATANTWATDRTSGLAAVAAADKEKKGDMTDDPLRAGSVWRGITTQKGKAPVSELPERWEVEMRILKREGDMVETLTTSTAGKFTRTVRARSRIKIRQEMGKAIGYELMDTVTLEDSIKGPGAKSWPVRVQGRFLVGDVIRGQWTSVVPEEGVDLYGDFEFRRVK
ncbi:MAG: hypothetical protein U0793_26295 [Gemmataceae bacterium]